MTVMAAIGFRFRIRNLSTNEIVFISVMMMIVMFKKMAVAVRYKVRVVVLRIGKHIVQQSPCPQKGQCYYSDDEAASHSGKNPKIS